MKRLALRQFGFMLIFLLITTACGQTAVKTDTPPTASVPATATTQASYPEELTIQQKVSFGSGPFAYTDTRAGLADLPGYQATLTITFEGTQAGQAQTWSKTYTMLASREPQARQLTIARTSSSSQLDPILMTEMDGMAYEHRGENACNANPVQEGNSLGERLEPASFLSGVIGADEAGSETVNGLEAKHYKFDQKALGEQGLTESNGELWVAADGNYIVKYLLTRKAKAGYFGEGIEGTLTLNYELRDPTQPVTIQLPAACPPGMVNAPLLPDAQNVSQGPGLLSYDSATALANATTFYQQQMPELGWKAQGQPSISDTAAFLDYKKGSQTLTIVITAEDSETAVNMVLENGIQ